MNELLSLLSAAVAYAMESPQNFVVVCGFVGWVGLFVQPMQRTAYKAKPTPRKGRKQKAATNRKNRTVQKTAKKAKPKKVKWVKPPKSTPERDARIEEMFRRGRGENKSDNWAGVPL